jgi:molybdate transport system substrate-binding protein
MNRQITPGRNKNEKDHCFNDTIYTRNTSSAQKFIDFLLSPEGKAIFQKYHYLMTPQEARCFTRPDTPVGGEYLVPEGWATK